MPPFTQPTFQERTQMAAKARETALKKLKAKPPISPEVLAERKAAQLAREQKQAIAREEKRAAFEKEKADGIDIAGDVAREAAADFDAMVEAIGEGQDCAVMLEKQDQVARSRWSSPPPTGMAGLSDDELASRLALHRERERIAAMDPEDIDISDLNPAEADDWDDLQWARAEYSGMTSEPGFWDKIPLEDDLYDDEDDCDDDDYDDDDDDGPGGDPDEPEADVRRFG